MTITDNGEVDRTIEYVGTANIVPGQHLLITRDITAWIQRETELRMKTRAMDKSPIGITISDPHQEDNPLATLLSGTTPRSTSWRSIRPKAGSEEGRPPHLAP